MNAIASELSYLVLLKQKSERESKPVLSRANRDKFPALAKPQPKPAWFSDFTATKGSGK